MRTLLPFCFFISFFISHSQVKTTHTYAIKDNDTLKLDIYTPKDIVNSQNLPVIVWAHGGGFAGGTRDNAADSKLCQTATEKGFIAVSISYRLLRKGTSTGFGCDCPKDDKMETFKQGVIDYMDALNYLINNAESLHIDSSKIIAGGSSAGAEIILNSVFMRDYFIDNPSLYSNINFAGLISLAGAVVNADYITDKNAVPSVMFHGRNDNLVPFATNAHHLCDPQKPGYIILDGSKTIANKLKENKTAYYFYQAENAGHEMADVPFEQLEEVFEFLKRTVLNDEIIQTSIIYRE